jgi:hypothetical protein
MKKRDLKDRIVQLETEIATLRERLELANYLLDLWYPYPSQYPIANITYPGRTDSPVRWPNYVSGCTTDESIRRFDVQSIT